MEKKFYSVKTWYGVTTKHVKVWAVSHEQAAVIALQDWKLDESEVGDITITPLSR